MWFIVLIYKLRYIISNITWDYFSILILVLTFVIYVHKYRLEFFYKPLNCFIQMCNKRYEMSVVVDYEFQVSLWLSSAVLRSKQIPRGLMFSAVGMNVTTSRASHKLWTHLTRNCDLISTE